MILQKIKKNRAFVILFAVTLSALLLAIALGISNIAFREVRFGTNARDTNDAFFAADVGAECALYNDKSTGSHFSGGSSSITCSNTTFTINENPSSKWRFTISGLGSQGKSCAIVIVDKSLQTEPTTTVTSNGYSSDDSSCSGSNPNRVERQLEVKY